MTSKGANLSLSEITCLHSQNIFVFVFFIFGWWLLPGEICKGGDGCEGEWKSGEGSGGEGWRVAVV